MKGERVMKSAAAAALVHCGTVIDPDDGVPLEKQTLRIENGKIVKISKGFLSPQKDDSLIDWSRFCVVPGFFDCHNHPTVSIGEPADPDTDRLVLQSVRAVKNCRIYLQNGITTLRDAGAVEAINISIKKAVRSGLMNGPDILAAGRRISRTGYPKWPVCREADGVEGVRRAVRMEQKAGADFIKLMVSGMLTSGPVNREYSDDEIYAAVGEAHARGLKIAAHAYGGSATTRAIQAGADSIEHGTYLEEEDLVEMAKRETFLVVTYGVSAYLAGLSSITPEARQHEVDGMKRYRKTLEMAKAHGVPVAIGGDAYHGGPAADVGALVESGFSPIEALRALTLNPARLCGLENHKGRVASGFRADLVALGQNPLENPLNVKDLQAVAKGGVIVSGFSG